MMKFVWFVTVSPLFDGNEGYALEELSIKERGAIKDPLFGTATPTADDIFITVDHREDTLRISYHNKAVILRRPSLLDGERDWIPYAYDTPGNWVQWDSNSDYGIRALRSTGEFDEVEYDSSDNFAPIAGLLRDGGNAVEGFWTSKTWVDDNKRVARARVIRDNKADIPKVKIESDRSTNERTPLSGREEVRFPIQQQGREHTITVTLSDNSEPIRRVEVDLNSAGRRAGR